VKIHAFTDGRDCDPKSSLPLLNDFTSFLSTKKAKLASICGRYYAMDRDKRWERVKLAYDMLIHGEGERSTNSLETIAKRYDAGETDEFLKPILTTDFKSIKEGDAVFCINFRTDRCREITQVLTQESFAEWNMHPLNLYYTTMTEYSKNFHDVHIVPMLKKHKFVWPKLKNIHT
jgi:2,3-bisphosphoglycerate-independent phosphoglycerate mutase